MAAGPDDADPNAATGTLSAPVAGIDPLARTAETGPGLADTGAAEAEAETDPLVHHRVPSDALFQWGDLYALVRLGAGGFGEVYRAYDPVLDRDVALKLHRANDRSAAYLAEARSLARVKHANVLAVHGADVHDGRAGIWTELVDGRDFESIVSGDGPFSGAETARIGVELCRALAAVHGAGMVHGDIKTHNVMRSRGGQIVLMDFGAVSPVDGAAGASAGTLVAMAPEVLDGGAPSVRSDIYALGVLLYRLASGRWPYDDLTVAGIKRGAQPRVPLRDRRADLSSSFVEVVERAMAPDPTARPGSAGVMERALMGLPSAAAPAAARAAPAAPSEPATRPESVAPPEAPPPAAPRQPRWLVAAAVGGLLLGALLLIWPASEPTDPIADAAVAMAPDATPPRAIATADVAETEPVDRSQYAAWRTPGGAFLLVPPYVRGARAPSYVGDGQTFYRQPGTGSSRAATTRWSYGYWDPRVPTGRHALFVYRDGSAHLDCGETTLPLTAVEAARAATLIAEATLMQPRWTRRAWLLARAPDGTYTFVDRAPGVERRDFRLFRGPRGALRELPLDIATVGESGSVFATPAGALHQGPLPSYLGDAYAPGAPDRVEWVAQDGSRTPLTRLPADAHAALIYGGLQVYASDQLGSPCDEAFAAAHGRGP